MQGIDHGPSSACRAEHGAGHWHDRRHVMPKVFFKMPTQDSLPEACQSGQKLFVPFNALVGRNKINKNKRNLEAHTADLYLRFVYLIFDLLSGFLAHASVSVILILIPMVLILMMINAKMDGI